VVIGFDNSKAEKIMRQLYRPLYLLETPIVATTIESAEIIKYASNSFLATKIAFINEVADLCEVVNADIQDVAKGMGLDNRIGSKFLHAGPGYGGSCFPKDVKAFVATAQNLKIDMSIVKSVNESNYNRPKKIVNKIINIFNDKIADKTFAILGLSFKPNTDDVRESTSMIIAKSLFETGAMINTYDPEAMKNAEEILPDLKYCDSVKDACKDTDAIIIATEWNEFRALDLKGLRKIVKTAIIFDLRNIYNKDEITNFDYEYYGIGK
jgi:UDPglucose 6-dehydrogenase